MGDSTIVNYRESGVSGDLRFGRGGSRVGRFGWGDVSGAFEKFAFVEDRTSTDEGDQMRRVDGPPAGLGGVDELVSHGDSRGP